MLLYLVDNDNDISIIHYFFYLNEKSYSKIDKYYQKVRFPKITWCEWYFFSYDFTNCRRCRTIVPIRCLQFYIIALGYYNNSYRRLCIGGSSEYYSLDLFSYIFTYLSDQLLNSQNDMEIPINLDDPVREVWMSYRHDIGFLSYLVSFLINDLKL